MVWYSVTEMWDNILMLIIFIMILLISEMHLSYLIQATQKYEYNENING